MGSIFTQVAGLLDAGEPVVLATITAHSGSTPRSAGTRMLVRQDGSSSGTIGGGALEAEVLAVAREAFAKRAATLRVYSFSGADAAAAGMICGGSAQVLVQYLPGGASEAGELYAALARATAEGRAAWLFTALPALGGWSASVPQALWDAGGRLAGGLALDADAARELIGAAGGREPVAIASRGRMLLAERVRAADTLYIFGAGHVAQMLAALAGFVGFEAVVIDDRAEFANRERFPGAARIVVTPDFAQAFTGLEIGRGDYLVIVTRGHQADRIVLRQALGTPAGYVGMIGSRRKTEAIFGALRGEGVPETALARVHAPIGVPIRAETPEEIAVSILAELIRARAELDEGVMGGCPAPG